MGDKRGVPMLTAVLCLELAGGEEACAAHARVLADAVSARGGAVVRRGPSGLVATFGSAGEAVAAVGFCQRAVPATGADGGSVPELRAGVTVGEVTVEADRAFGLPVVEASRLCGVAANGGVLVSDVVRALAGTVPGASFDAAGIFELAGLARPVTAYALSWARGVASPIPLPAVLATGQSSAFVGRAAERASLDRAWRSAVAGVKQSVLLVGEPGIGKTRLAAEFAADANAQGAVVLYGRCDDGVGMAFQPFVGALRYYVAHSSHAELSRGLGRHAAELVRLVPEVEERLAHVPAAKAADPELETIRLFDAVAGWLSAVSRDHPMVLVLDDLHWAARPTLLLLRHILLADDPMRLLVVGTYRDVDVAVVEALDGTVGELRDGGADPVCVALGGLDESDVAALVAAAVGGTLEAAASGLARTVRDESSGNPFFVGEIVRHLVDSGALYRHDGQWRLDRRLDQLGVPESARDAIRGRLGRLDAATTALLDRASVIGTEFDLDVLRAVGDLDEGQLLAALDDAARSRLIEPVPGSFVRHRFTHALVRATLYEELNAVRRTQLHRRVGQALEALGPSGARPASELAHHFALGAAGGDVERAIAYSVCAGDRARDQLAHEEAAAWYRRALELVDAERGGDRARHALLLALGEAERRAGLASSRDTLLEAARAAQEIGDADGMARAALANSRWFFSEVGQPDRERVEVFDRALGALDPADSTIRARLLATLASELVWAPEGDRRFGLSDDALAMARRLGDPRTLAEVLTLRFLTIDAIDTLDERRRNAEELLVTAASLGDPMLEFLAWQREMFVGAATGDRGRLYGAFARVVALSQELRQPAVRWLAVVGQAGDALLNGDLDAAERHAREGLRIGRATGQPDAQSVVGGQLLWIHRWRGRLDRVIDAAVASVDAAGVDPDRTTTRFLLEAGRVEECRRRYEAAVGCGIASFRRDHVQGAALTNLAHVCARIGDRPQAREFHRALSPHAETFFQTAFLQPVTAHFLGMLADTLGRADEADSHFATAVRLHERMRAPLFLAETELEWARVLLRRGDAGSVGRARDLLQRAVATAAERGAAAIERDGRTLLGVGD